MSKEKFCNCADEYRNLSRTIDREWNQALPAIEFSIVRFIFDRTAGWSKKWEQIPLRHFTECVVSRDGSKNYGGVYATSRSTIIGAIRSLVERGTILREPTGRSFFYAINFEWKPRMKTPKRLKQETGEAAKTEKGGENDKNVSKNWTIDVSKNWTIDGPKIGPIRYKKEIYPKKEDNAQSALAEKRGEIEEAQREVEAHSRLRREAQRKEGHYCRKGGTGFVPTERALRKTWEDLHVEIFPNDPCAPLSKRALHMMRSYCREWNQRNPSGEFMDFFQWLFENWSIVRVTSLSWMRDAPEIPQPMFIANSKLRPHLEESWAKRKKIEDLRKLSPRERQVELLKSRGVEGEVAERMATERQENEETLKKIKREQGKLDAAKRYQAPTVDERKVLSRPVRPKAPTKESESKVGGNNNLSKTLPSWDDLPD